jgi:hypothetical protein
MNPADLSLEESEVAGVSLRGHFGSVDEAPSSLPLIRRVLAEKIEISRAAGRH